MPPSDLRLALAQSPGALTGVEARMAWLERTLATLEPADILLLPECFTTGYHAPDQIPTLAEAADGPNAQRVAALARAHGVAIAYGFPERADGVLFNSANFIATDGTIRHTHRKLALPPGIERDLYAPGAGAETFRYAGLTLGLLICYDVEFPETVRHLARAGADLVLVPTALGRDYPWVAQTSVPARAYENGVHVAYADHCGTENGHAYAGLSVVAGPQGRVLAHAGTEPGVIYAPIDSLSCENARTDVPYLEDAAKLCLNAANGLPE